MIPIEPNSVLLDTDVANDLANILAEDETSEIDMAIDSEWTLIIDIKRHSTKSIKRFTVANGLWEAYYSA